MKEFMDKFKLEFGKQIRYITLVVLSSTIVWVLLVMPSMLSALFLLENLSGKELFSRGYKTPASLSNSRRRSPLNLATHSFTLPIADQFNYFPLAELARL